MSSHFALGSYNGQPSLIMVSPKGKLLKNVPETLREHVNLSHVSDQTIQKMGLGPDGKFWLRCKVGKEDVHWTISEDLDVLIKETKEEGWIRHFAFGESAGWGVQFTAGPCHTFQNNAVPQDFTNETNALSTKPTWRTWDHINFVAFGVGNTWVFGVDEIPTWSKTLEENYPTLAEMLNANKSGKGDVRRKIHTIALSPDDKDYFVMQYHDGQVVSRVPGDWAKEISEYADFPRALPRRASQAEKAALRRASQQSETLKTERRFSWMRIGKD